MAKALPHKAIPSPSRAPHAHTYTRADPAHTHTRTHFYLNLEPSLGRGKEGEGVGGRGGEGGDGGGGEGRRGRVAYILLSQTHIWKEGERCAH